jgi:hypothetical protein
MGIRDLISGINNLSDRQAEDMFANSMNNSVSKETASRTLNIQDAGNFLLCNSASNIVMTVPDDATVPWEGLVFITEGRKGAGTVTFLAGAGVTIQGDLATPAQYKCKSIMHVGPNEWWVV